MFIYLCVSWHHVCVEVRGQLKGVDSPAMWVSGIKQDVRFSSKQLNWRSHLDGPKFKFMGSCWHCLLPASSFLLATAVLWKGGAPIPCCRWEDGTKFWVTAMGFLVRRKPVHRTPLALGDEKLYILPHWVLPLPSCPLPFSHLHLLLIFLLTLAGC